MMTNTEKKVNQALEEAARRAMGVFGFVDLYFIGLDRCYHPILVSDNSADMYEYNDPVHHIVHILPQLVNVNFRNRIKPHSCIYLVGTECLYRQIFECPENFIGLLDDMNRNPYCIEHGTMTFLFILPKKTPSKGGALLARRRYQSTLHTKILENNNFQVYTGKVKASRNGLIYNLTKVYDDESNSTIN